MRVSCVKVSLNAIPKKKSIAGQVLTYNSKNFHRLNKKLDLKRPMGKFEKPFLRKTDQKAKKNRKSRSK